MMDFFGDVQGVSRLCQWVTTLGMGLLRILIWLKELVRRGEMKDEFRMRIGLREWVGQTDLEKYFISTGSRSDR